jgi:glutaconyl-CoA/methylmalonyl-CoA decarboxylase subunit gamma
MKYQIRIQKKAFEVDILEAADGHARVTVDGTPYEIAYSGGPRAGAPAAARASRPAALTHHAPAPRKPAAGAPGTLAAPIPGIILQILVQPGDAVKAGQVVAVMEAMKMENNLAAEVSGTVREVQVQKGSEVSTGDVIMIIDAG